MATKQEIETFFNAMGSIAAKVCKERGYGNAQIWTCLCQGAKETGYGKSELALKAHNYFGIKANTDWINKSNKIYDKDTGECYDGKNYVTIHANFRAYNNMEESVRDYFTFLAKDRYKECLTKTTVLDCITVIKNGGYATSPTYIETINSLFNQQKNYITKWTVKEETKTMAYTNSPLATVVKQSPNYSNDRKCINRITIHHCASNPLNAAQIANIFAKSSRGASCNYGVGNDGSIALICAEKYRSWCSSNPTNDKMAITMEVSNSKYGEPWPISDKAYKAMIDLCVDICKRNGANKVIEISDEISKLPQSQRANYSNNYNVPAGTILLTQHNYFNATACPGTTIKNMWKQICADINKALNGGKVDTTVPSSNNNNNNNNNNVVINSNYVYNKVDYSPVFDASYYAAHNADVVKVFGNTSSGLFKHFTQYGMKEGRQGCATFNVYVYKNNYKDLRDAFGDDLPAYYKHYCVYGKNEGRKCI